MWWAVSGCEGGRGTSTWSPAGQRRPVSSVPGVRGSRSMRRDGFCVSLMVMRANLFGLFGSNWSACAGDLSGFGSSRDGGVIDRSDAVSALFSCSNFFARSGDNLGF